MQFDVTKPYENRAADVKQAEKKLVSQEIRSGALPLETLSKLQNTIKEFNTDITNTMNGLTALSNLQKSTLTEKETTLKNVRFKFFRKTKVAVLRKEIASLTKGAETVSKQLQTLEKIQKTVSETRNLHTEDRLVGQLSAQNTAQDLATIRSSDEKTNQVINHYRNILSSNPHLHSFEQKSAIVKAIIAAVTTGVALEENLFSVTLPDHAGHHQIVHFNREGASVSAGIATFIGQGADAQVFRAKGANFDVALKVSKPEIDSKARFQQEKIAHTHLKRAIENNPDHPGASCIEEFHGIKNIHTGQEAILTHYYDQGSLEKHIILQQFAEILEITDPTLLESKLGVFLDNQLAAAREAGDKTLTKEQLLANLTKQLKTEYTPFTTPMRWQMTLQITAGAEFMMNAGIIHADIKPGNIRCSEGRFVHGDFGTALRREDVERLAKLAATCRVSQQSRAKSEQCTSMQAIASGLPVHPSSTIHDFETFMQVMQRAKVVTEKNGKYEITSDANKLATLLTDIAKSTLSAKKLAQADKKFLENLKDAGVIREENGSYVTAMTLSPEAQSEALSFFKFLARPANTFVNTNAYSSPADENWIQFSAYSGDSARLMLAIDSQQTFALGVTLIEAITGERPLRNQTGPSTTKEQQDKIRASLQAKDFPAEFCDIVIEMVRDQGMDPDSLYDAVVVSGAFPPEQEDDIKNEIEKVKRGEIAAETSELLQQAATQLKIDPEQLKYTPREPLSSLLDRLWGLTPG